MMLQTRLPLAMGEHGVTRWEFLDMMDRGGVSVVQPYMTTCGGLTEAKRIATLAQAQNLRVAPHVWGGAVGLATAMHLIAALPDTLSDALPAGIDVTAVAVIEPGAESLQQAVTSCSWDIVLRDVTPEAVREIAIRELPGFGEIMRAESMKITKNAILSRNLAAIVDRALVICLPGKPSGAVECLGFVVGAPNHAELACLQLAFAYDEATRWSARRPPPLIA